MPANILIVEDDAALGAQVALLMDERGWDPMHVETLDAARPHLAAADVVILDLTLQGHRDPLIVRRVRRLTDGVPVVVMTGDEAEATFIECVEAGACDVVYKDKSIRRRLWMAITKALENPMPNDRGLMRISRGFKRMAQGRDVDEVTFPPGVLGAAR